MYVNCIVGSVNQELNAMALHHWKYGVVSTTWFCHITSTSYSGYTRRMLVGCCQRFRLWFNYCLPSPYISISLFSPRISHCHGNEFWLNFNTISTHTKKNSKLFCLAKRGKQASERQKENKTKNSNVNEKLKWWPNEKWKRNESRQKSDHVIFVHYIYIKNFQNRIPLLSPSSQNSMLKLNGKNTGSKNV